MSGRKVFLDELEGRVPTENRHAAWMAEMRGDGFAPDGHDPEVIPQTRQGFPCRHGGPSAPYLANWNPAHERRHGHVLNEVLRYPQQPLYQLFNESHQKEREEASA
jgi:hypothetical protein